MFRQTGGVIGCAAYRNITGDDYCRTIEAWCGMVARTVDIAGIDSVAIGTDRSHNFSAPDYAWMRQGRWTRGIDYGAGVQYRPPLSDNMVVAGGIAAMTLAGGMRDIYVRSHVFSTFVNVRFAF